MARFTVVTVGVLYRGGAHESWHDAERCREVVTNAVSVGASNCIVSNLTVTGQTNLQNILPQGDLGMGIFTNQESITNGAD